MFLFDILDFDLRSLLTMPALCPTTAKAAAQHPKMLEYAKRCKWTPSTSPMNVATLLGAVMCSRLLEPPMPFVLQVSGDYYILALLHVLSFSIDKLSFNYSG